MPLKLFVKLITNWRFAERQNKSDVSLCKRLSPKSQTLFLSFSPKNPQPYPQVWGISLRTRRHGFKFVLEEGLLRQRRTVNNGLSKQPGGFSLDLFSKLHFFGDLRRQFRARTSMYEKNTPVLRASISWHGTSPKRVLKEVYFFFQVMPRSKLHSKPTKMS